MTINCELRRKGDKVRFFQLEFNSTTVLSNFLYDLFKADTIGEVFELRVWEQNK